MLGFLPPTSKPEWFRVQRRSETNLLFPAGLFIPLLHFTALCKWLHFLSQIEGPRLPCTEQVEATFPKPFVHFVSLCPILVIRTIFPAFMIVISATVSVSLMLMLRLIRTQTVAS